MKYRVAFILFNGHYFSEWFDTFAEAEEFVTNAFKAYGTEPLWIENEDGEVI